METRSDTIAAISTALGKGGIGIIRISGEDALSIVSTLVLSKKDLLSLSQIKSRKLIHARLIDQYKQPIDEVLLAIMPKNRSFTGEFTIEINCHGGIALLTMALEAVIRAGARLATPGEFTKRAWKNGKLDLIKAEAINQIISADSFDSLKIARKQFNGGLSARCTELREKLVTLISYIQFNIDIEGEDRSPDLKYIQNEVLLVKQAIELMLSSSERNRSMSDGVWVSIYGPPNVGKSSIFNALLKLQRSIVCDMPGTTRDHISEKININGINIRLTDTAGIRETEDIIEKESIKRSYEQINTSDIRIYVLDSSLDLNNEHIMEIESVFKNKGIMVLNKCDLKASESVIRFISQFKNHSDIINVSALSGDKIQELEKRIEQKITDQYENVEELMLTLRQSQCMKTCLSSLDRFDIKDGVELDMLCYDLTQAVQSIDEITGVISNEDILESVFKNFCVGK